jgi:toxin FitB
VIVMDTNVVSEFMNPSPHAAVRAWVQSLGDQQLFTTSITFAEVFRGIERLPDGKRKIVLRTAAANVFAEFGDRILPFDTPAAAQYATLVCERDRRGRPLKGFDAHIASICRAHDAELATRNVKDFVHTGVPVIDPWAEA